MTDRQISTSSYSILRVETGYLSSQTRGEGDYLDYNVYNDYPVVLRKIEQLLRFDFYLALKVRKVARNYDMIWARSEKVGIPLSFMGLPQPLVLNAHHLEFPPRAGFIKLTGIARKWAAVGYYSDKQKEYLIRELGINEEVLFFSEIPNYLDVDPKKSTFEGPIISLGVSKRDYATLLKALAPLEGCETELFVSSRYGDKPSRKLREDIPEWVKIVGFCPENEILQKYREAKFVILPLQNTRQTGSGISVIFEAGAFGKAVIATRTGGSETLIIDGETGILVPPYDVEAMRAAIRRLWDDPECAKEMGRQARRYIETRFKPEKISKQREQIFTRIVAAQKEATL